MSKEIASKNMHHELTEIKTGKICVAQAIRAQHHLVYDEISEAVLGGVRVVKEVPGVAEGG